jgi:integrase
MVREQPKQEQEQEPKEQRITEIKFKIPGGSSSHASETRAAYSRNFKRFLDHIKIHDVQVLLDQKPKVITQMIVEYVDYLREDYLSKKGGDRLSRSSIEVHCASVRDFLDTNYEDFDSIPWRRVKRHLPPHESTHDDRAYTVEEIHRILEKCDERSRVIILLMASTGMRIGAIHELPIGDLTPVTSNNFSLYKIWVYARWKGDKYYSYCSPETKQAIDTYLAYRQRFGEVLKPECPLIREQFNIDRHLRQKARALSKPEIIYLVNEALRRSGVRTAEVMRSYGLRKFYVSQMIKAKADYNTREYLVGHGKHSRGLDVSYDRIGEDDRLAEYCKAVDLLTISPEHRLKKKVSQLESQADKSVLLEGQVGQLREEMAKMHALVNEMPRIAHGLNEAGHEMGELGHNLTEAVQILQLVHDPQRMNQLLQQLILKMQRKPEQKQVESKELQG